jgi:hypothetical protein
MDKENLGVTNDRRVCKSLWLNWRVSYARQSTELAYGCVVLEGKAKDGCDPQKGVVFVNVWSDPS